MPAWPGTLPAYVLQQGYDEALPDNVIESPMDSGPAKRRPRSTVASRMIRCQIAMTVAQAAIFESFWEVDCAQGSLSFTWVHPRTRAARTMAFRKPPPSVVRADGDLVIFSVRIEVLP